MQHKLPFDVEAAFLVRPICLLHATEAAFLVRPICLLHATEAAEAAFLVGMVCLRDQSMQ